MSAETKIINKQLFTFFLLSPVSYITSFWLYEVGVSEGHGRITSGKQSSTEVNELLHLGSLFSCITPHKVDFVEIRSRICNTANYPCDQRKSRENKKKGYWDWRRVAHKPALGWDVVFPTDGSLFISCLIGLYYIKHRLFKFEYKYHIDDRTQYFKYEIML